MAAVYGSRSRRALGPRRRPELFEQPLQLVPVVVAAGLLSAKDGDEALAYLKDAGNFSIGLLVISIQGRKPGGGG
jgi:hypothetical protein